MPELYYSGFPSVNRTLRPGSADFSELVAAAGRSFERRLPGARKPGVSDDDVELLNRCRKGDESAWQALVQRHTRRVFSVAYRFSGRVEEAEDLTQEVFVKVYQSLSRFEPAAGSFATWLTAVARNHSIDHYRRRREERRRTTEDPALLESLPTREEAQDHRLAREQRAQLVRRALRGLPLELREGLVLCDLQGLAYDEIAELLKLPLGTVKSRINRGRLELAKRLAARRAEFEEDL
jgi:RNA polymerase sigma-70 factor (ECF subfamily)